MSLRANVVSVVAALTEDLRSRILSGEITPGTAFSEADLATRYSVSRPTARSALDALVTARLMSRGPHKIARVTELSPEDVDDIYQTRFLIESGAVRHLAMRQEVPEAARIANREIADLAKASPRDIVGPDLTFHRSLVSALQSERTDLAYSILTDEVEMCMSQVQDAGLLNTESIVQEHESILDAIGAGKLTLAESTLEDHLDRARVRLRTHLAQH